MNFKTVKTILTAAQENQQAGTIFIKGEVEISFYFYTRKDIYTRKDWEPDGFGYDSDTGVIWMLNSFHNYYIDCEAIISIELFNK